MNLFPSLWTTNYKTPALGNEKTRVKYGLLSLSPERVFRIYLILFILPSSPLWSKVESPCSHWNGSSMRTGITLVLCECVCHAQLTVQHISRTQDTFVGWSFIYCSEEREQKALHSHSKYPSPWFFLPAYRVRGRYDERAGLGQIP